MKNIVNDLSMVAFRGQLYKGERKKLLTSNNFIHGDGIYFSTSFSDASGYAKANTTNNKDLSGSAEQLSKETGLSYIEARDYLTEGGDGKVMTAVIKAKKTIVYGGERFTDITNVSDFNNKFGYALTLAGADMEKRDSTLRFMIKNNHKPEAINERLIRENLGSSLREYASILNCDSFITRPNITPASDEVEHIVLLDSAQLKVVCWDDPIAIKPEAYLPNFDSDEFNKLQKEHLLSCKKIEMGNIRRAKFLNSINTLNQPKEGNVSQENIASRRPSLK